MIAGFCCISALWGSYAKPYNYLLGSMKYTLDNGEELNQEFPETFDIPSRSERENLLPGELVKLIFRISIENEVFVERMWVCVQSQTKLGYIGLLDNDPYCTKQLRSGATVTFCPEHVIQIYEQLPSA